MSDLRMQYPGCRFRALARLKRGSSVYSCMREKTKLGEVKKNFEMYAFFPGYAYNKKAKLFLTTLENIAEFIKSLNRLHNSQVFQEGN